MTNEQKNALQWIISKLDDFLYDEDITEQQMRKLEPLWIELKLLYSNLK
jgi:hypothetical protein